MRETGLYYYRHRIYHAQLGRFCSRDPLGYADGPNLLTYVVARPTVLVDPSGLVNPAGVYWALRIGALAAGTASSITWAHDKANAPWTELLNQTDVGKVPNTSFCAHASGTSAERRACPNGPTRRGKVLFFRMGPQVAME